MAESGLGRWQAVAAMAPKQRSGPDKDLSSEHKSLNPNNQQWNRAITRQL